MYLFFVVYCAQGLYMRTNDVRSPWAWSRPFGPVPFINCFPGSVDFDKLCLRQQKSLDAQINANPVPSSIRRSLPVIPANRFRG